MPTKYWYGGSGNFNSGTSHWSLNSGNSPASTTTTPTNLDDVVFDANSGTGTCTITATAAVHSWDGSAANNISVACSGTRTLTIGGGAGTASAAVFKIGGHPSWDGSGGSMTLTCDNRSGGTTWTSGGVALAGMVNVNLTGTNASQTTTTLADSWTMSGSGISVELQRGGLVITSGTTLTVTGTATSAGTFNYTGSAGTTTLTMSGATVTCGRWSESGGGTLTLTDNTSSVINLQGRGNASPNIMLKTYGGSINIVPTAATSGLPIGMTNTGASLRNLTITPYSTDIYTEVVFNTNTTLTGTFTVSTPDAAHRVCVRSQSNTVSLTSTGVTWAVTDCDFEGINSSTTITGTRIGNRGNNSNVTATTPKNVYFVRGSGSYWADEWSTSSGGSTSVNNFPLPQDTAIIDAASFSSDGTNWTLLDTPVVPAMDFSALDQTVLFSFGASGVWAERYFYGDVELSSNMTFSANAGINVHMKPLDNSLSWTSNGAVNGISGASFFYMDRMGDTITFQDDFEWWGSSTSTGVIMSNATVNFLGNVKVNFLTVTGSPTISFTSGKTIWCMLCNSGAYAFNLVGATYNINGANLRIGASATNQIYVLGGATKDWGSLTIDPAAGPVQLYCGSTTTSSGTTTFTDCTMTPGTGGRNVQVINLIATTNTIGFDSGFVHCQPSNVLTITAYTPPLRLAVVGEVTGSYISSNGIAVQTGSGGNSLILYHSIATGSSSAYTGGVKFIDSQAETFENYQFVGAGGNGVMAFGERRPVL